ncbi:hypothetical protein [Methanobacterium aggregans]|uniref:hypothetical protein n=1 Tax=Methanobacterium aggregans TaxID=1615586 RepID=UPI001AE3E621|nr:hypothetical protein [Methanobacterium aggregans]MBP2046359.1 hypothetical protein [Methanobacterium aggregans]
MEEDYNLEIKKKSGRSLIGGGLFFILLTLTTLMTPNRQFFAPVFGSWGFVALSLGVILSKDYHDLSLYRVVLAVFLIGMLIFAYLNAPEYTIAFYVLITIYLGTFIFLSSGSSLYPQKNKKISFKPLILNLVSFFMMLGILGFHEYPETSIYFLITALIVIVLTLLIGNFVIKRTFK